MPDARKAAYLSLLSCEQNQRYTNIEADTVIKRSGFSSDERRLYTALLYGVTERRITLDYQIYKLSGRDLKKLQPKLLALLRLGLYQLCYMNSIPDHAAVSSVMQLAQEQLNRGACGMLNAILREAQRNLKDTDGVFHPITPDRTRDICGFLSITHSYPRYLCKIWCKAYGVEKAEAIMQAQNRQTPLFLRTNTLKTTRIDLLNHLIKSGHNAEMSSTTSDGIILRDGAAISSLEPLTAGECFVQDEASKLCVEALDPKEGETVFDTCACPGGKSFAAAIMMNNKGRILSTDIHESKLSLIASGAARLGINIIDSQCADASVFQPELYLQADRVLCDVPCSGFGTIAKKPDLRHKDAESVRALPSLQLKILENVSKYVKKHGTLVYSTCTLNPAENEHNVNAFLLLHPEFSLVTMKTLFPDEGEHDGFFFAKMVRIEA